MVTKRDPDIVTEDTEAAVKDLETIWQRQERPREDDDEDADDNIQDVTAKLIDIEANKENIILIGDFSAI